MRGEEHDLNQAAYRKLEADINKEYPYGRFVGIVGGQIVADAGDFDELHSFLRKEGTDPRNAFIVQAGHQYPESAVIFVIETMS